MAARLTPTMQAAVAAAVEHGGRLVRWPGGFWTYDGCAVTYVQHGPSGDYEVPEWSVSVGTIRALVARGVAAEVDWRETRSGRYVVAVEVTE